VSVKLSVKLDTKVAPLSVSVVVTTLVVGTSEVTTAVKSVVRLSNLFLIVSAAKKKDTPVVPL
jgi:hypothetical protein